MNALTRRAPATAAVAALTTLVSLGLELSGYAPHAALYAGFVPARASLGLAGDVPGLLPVALTPLGATLIHGGLAHLAMNMLMLGYIGVMVERALGSRGVIVLYLVGAYAACVGQWLPDPRSTVPMIGASGAVSALVGAYALLYGRRKTRDVGPLPAWLLHVLWLLAAWAVLNLLVGVLSAQMGMPIAAAAHIGGFVAGLALCRPLLMWRWRGA